MIVVSLALRLLRLTPMTPQELRDRTMEFALAAFRLASPMMREPLARHVARQLFRAATAVAANYRSAGLGRSTREFVAKLGIVREEADEAVFWIEFARRSGLITSAESEKLFTEARELAAIFSAAYRTSRARSVRK
jgi:four helix bundle protein